MRALLPLYKEVLQQLVDAGAQYIQVDEPILVTDSARLMKQSRKKHMII